MTVVEVVPAGASRKETIARLLDAYLGELHAHRELPVGASSASTYPYLSSYWEEPAWYPFLIRADRRVVGFAVVRGPEWTGAHGTQMAEFYIAPRQRRHGVGQAAAMILLQRFPGKWELQAHPRNAAAVAFWTRVTAQGCVTLEAVSAILAADGQRLQFTFHVAADKRVP